MHTHFTMRPLVSAILAAAAIGLVLVAPASALQRKNAAIIDYVPTNKHPPVPSGLKVTCLTGPNVLTSSKTCPVVKYLGITTWAYSFIDNRMSLALVSYDAHNKVVRNVTKDGLRYVWVMTSSLPNMTVNVVGQGNQTVTVPWDELGPAK